MKNLFILLFIFTLIGLSELQTGSTGRPTTYRPRAIFCYRCSYSNCPRPFTRQGVSTFLSSNGWCAKMTNYPNDNLQPATRDIDGGNCAARGYSGCFPWETVQGVNTYLCCCNRAGCNSANSNSYSKLFILFAILLKTTFFL